MQLEINGIGEAVGTGFAQEVCWQDTSQGSVIEFNAEGVR
jgi:hypothetical protein